MIQVSHLSFSYTKKPFIVLLVRGFGHLLTTGMGLTIMGLSVLLFFAANVAAAACPPL